MTTLVIAPHPDDEVLGCGGTLLCRNEEGITLGWLIVTTASEYPGWGKQQVSKRDRQIEQVRKRLEISKDHLYCLNLPTTSLDSIPMSQLVTAIGEVINEFRPDELLVPHHGDIHSDHRIVAEACRSCAKWYRNPTVKRMMAYETLSETHQSFDETEMFRPNVFVDISNTLDKKIELLGIYESEMGDHPFPRSSDSVKSLAKFRGSSCGVVAAEAFELVFQRP